MGEATRAEPRARRATPPVADFTAALVDGDARRARQIATAYFDSTGSRLAVISDLLHPAQYEVGELWYQGRVGIAEEHRATSIVVSTADSLAPTPAARPVKAGSRCLLAGLGGEQHVVGLRLLTFALEDDGWTVEQLLPPTPRPELVRAVMDSTPQVVGISAAYLPTTREIGATIADVKRLAVRVIVGGPLFNRMPDLWRHLGADGHGSDARVSLMLMRKLLRASQ